MRNPSLQATAALAAFLVASSVLGQGSAGSLRGTVLDPAGQRLAGAIVTVRSSALLQPRSVTSGPQGTFLFASLPVGVYQVDGALAGFTTFHADGVRVRLGGSVTLELKLQALGVQLETLVEAAAPILDPTEVGTGDRVTSEELVQVPTARDPWAVLALVPGLQMDRVNVGGSESGQQSGFVAKGEPTTSTTWMLDGVVITEAAALGASTTYYDFGTIEEVQVSTGANPVSQLTGGVGINIVTKHGSNELRGSAQAFYTDEALQQENVSDSLEALGFRSPKVNQILELGAEAGGPILRDRLWIWGSASRNHIEQRTITTSAEFPDGYPDDTTIVNFAGKLNARLSENNEANFLVNYNNKIKLGREVSPTRPPETAWHQTGGTPIVKFEDQQIFGDDAILSFKLAYVAGGFSLRPQGGSPDTGDPNAPQARFHLSTETWSRNYLDTENDRPQFEFMLEGSHFRNAGQVDHDFKFGFAYRETSATSATFWDGGGLVIDLDDTRRDLFATVAPYRASNGSSTLSLYASDTLTRGNLTIQLGLRFDDQTSRNTESARGENPMFPEIFSELVYEGDEDAPVTWTNLSPRIGLSYQVGAQTQISATYALYSDQIALGYSSPLNPINYQYFYTFFQDANGDGQASRDEMIATPDQPCSGYCLDAVGFDPAHPDALAIVNEIDEDLAAPKSHELILGATRQLGRDSSLSIHGTWRHRYDQLQGVRFVFDDVLGERRPVRYEDWVVGGTYTGEGAPEGNDEGDFVLEPYSVTWYTLREGVGFVPGSYYRNVPGYFTRYLGAELVFQKRFGSDWSLAANLAVNDLTEHFTVGGDGDITPNRTVPTQFDPIDDGGAVAQLGGRPSGSDSGVFLNTDWQSNVRGMYRISNIGLDLGANFTLRQGYPSPFVHRGPTPSKGDLTQDTPLLIGKLDDQRMNPLAYLDLRVAKVFGLHVGSQSSELELGVDVFNVFNAGTVTQHHRSANSPSFLMPREILGPRLFRLGARVTF